MDQTLSVRRARLTLAEQSEGEATLTVPGTSYRLTLRVLRAVEREPGQRVEGVIRASARRVDVVGTGGRYIEPVFGRPRRIQGLVLEVDSGASALVVDAGVPLVCVLAAAQRSSAFSEGDFVAFDVLPDASFTPA